MTTPQTAAPVTQQPTTFFKGKDMANNPNAQVTVSKLMEFFEARNLKDKNTRSDANVKGSAVPANPLN